MVNKETTWHSSPESLKRLGKELEICNHLSKFARADYDEKSLKLWMAAIISAYKEIHPKMTKQEIMEYKKLWNQFKFNNKPIYNTKVTQFGPRKQINKMAYEYKIKFYDKIETFLRRVATKHGMLITDKANIMDVMGDEI